MIQRRAFLTGLISLIAAPAIVRAGSLMPVKAEPLVIVRPPQLKRFVVIRTAIPMDAWRQINQGVMPLGQNFTSLIAQVSDDGKNWTDAPELPIKTAVGDEVTMVLR